MTKTEAEKLLKEWTDRFAEETDHMSGKRLGLFILVDNLIEAATIVERNRIREEMLSFGKKQPPNQK